MRELAAHEGPCRLQLGASLEKAEQLLLANAARTSRMRVDGKGLEDRTLCLHEASIHRRRVRYTREN